MSATASPVEKIEWAMNALAWAFWKLVWIALLLVGLFFALLMTARGLVDKEFQYWDIGLFFSALIPIAIPGLINLTAIRHRHTRDQPQVAITIRRSWWATGARAAGLLMMALVCSNAIASGIEDGFSLGLAAAAAVLFALTAVSLIRLQLTATLALSPEGLDYSLFRIGPIPWRDIDSVDVVRVLRSSAVALRLHDEEKYFRRGFKRLTGLARIFASTPFLVPDAMFDVSPGWLKRAIEIRLDYFRSANQPHAVERQGSH